MKYYVFILNNEKLPEVLEFDNASDFVDYLQALCLENVRHETIIQVVYGYKFG